jgi:hypothetical protein
MINMNRSIAIESSVTDQAPPLLLLKHRVKLLKSHAVFSSQRSRPCRSPSLVTFDVSLLRRNAGCLKSTLAFAFFGGQWNVKVAILFSLPELTSKALSGFDMRALPIFRLEGARAWFAVSHEAIFRGFVEVEKLVRRGLLFFAFTRATLQRYSLSVHDACASIAQQIELGSFRDRLPCSSLTILHDLGGF